LLPSKRTEYFEALPVERKAWILALRQWVSSEKDITVDTANHWLYQIPQSADSTADSRRLQKTFFTDVYQLLFGKNSGPRLGTFMAAVPKEDYFLLIDFPSAVLI
jgi:lysyl-tRNA synthetase class I